MRLEAGWDRALNAVRPQLLFSDKWRSGDELGSFYGAVMRRKDKTENFTAARVRRKIKASPVRKIDRKHDV